MSVLTPDPMDTPDPNYHDGDNATDLARIEQEVLANPDPPFTWDQIRAAARQELHSEAFTARITESHVQKNSEIVDSMLDMMNGNETLPDDLLAKTQAITRETHMEADK